MFGYITDPAAPGGLVRRELAEPKPAPNEVVIAVRAYSVNRGELMLLRNRPDGWRPGQDVAGEVVIAAADGSGPAVGTRVVALADSAGWAERVPVPSERVAVLPDNVPFTQAATLPIAGLTALRALRTGGPLLGRRVLVTGASGGVGSIAVQLALASGARVTGQVSGPHRIAAVRALGDVEAVVELDTSVGPFDLVVDGVGGDVLTAAVRRLAPRGTAATFGIASGKPSTLSFIDFASGPLARVVGVFVYAGGQGTFSEDLGVLVRLVADGRLKVPTSVQLDWGKTLEAVEALRDRRVVGKAVLTVG